MEDDAAWICLAIYITGSYVWYKYCIRIFNRFQLRSVGFAWKDDDDERPEAGRGSEDSAQSSYSHVHRAEGHSTLLSGASLESGGTNKAKKHSLLGKLARMTGGDLKCVHVLRVTLTV